LVHGQFGILAASARLLLVTARNVPLDGLRSLSLVAVLLALLSKNAVSAPYLRAAAALLA